jgi:hypothetical protein
LSWILNAPCEGCVSGQAQRDKFRRQIGAPGCDDDELLAVQHVADARFDADMARIKKEKEKERK